MKSLSPWVLFIFCVVICGCQSISSDVEEVPPEEQYQSAVTSVVESITQQDVSQKDLEELVDQIKNDPQARSAVEAIEESMKNQNKQVKYCPSTGKRYAAHLDMADDCPEPLEYVDQ